MLSQESEGDHLKSYYDLPIRYFCWSIKELTQPIREISILILEFLSLGERPP